jgi:hypothetical protein
MVLRLLVRPIPAAATLGVRPVCNLAQTELMVVIVWAAVGVGLTVSGGVAQIVGIVLLALLVLLLVRGAVDTWKNEKKVRAAARDSRREGEIDA